jgi:hypothetical protein
MFQINDSRYMQIVRDPAKADRHGYIGTESWTTSDEVALRDELGRLGFTEDQSTAAIALARMMFVGS